jgi:hypothetical protein
MVEVAAHGPSEAEGWITFKAHMKGRRRERLWWLRLRRLGLRIGAVVGLSTAAFRHATQRNGSGRSD